MDVVLRVAVGHALCLSWSAILQHAPNVSPPTGLHLPLRTLPKAYAPGLGCSALRAGAMVRTKLSRLRSACFAQSTQGRYLWRFVFRKCPSSVGSTCHHGWRKLLERWAVHC